MAAGALDAAGELVQVVSSLAAVVIAAPRFKRTGLGSVLGYFVEGLSIGSFSFGLFTDGPRSPHVVRRRILRPTSLSPL